MPSVTLPQTGGRYNAHSLLWMETETDAGKALLVQAERGQASSRPDVMFLPLCQESSDALREMARAIDVALNPELTTLGAAESTDLVIAPDYCPKCGARELRWTSSEPVGLMTTAGPQDFIDIYRCDACGHEERVESRLTVTSTADEWVVAGRSNGGA